MEADRMVDKWVKDPSGQFPCPVGLSHSSYCIASLCREIIDEEHQQYLVAYMVYHQTFINQSYPPNTYSDREFEENITKHSPNDNITKMRLELWRLLK